MTFPLALLEVTCAWCGTIRVPVDDVRCATEPSSQQTGICELHCPSCERLLLHKATADEVEMLIARGAQEWDGLVPFELLEEKPGPRISVDDVIEAVLTMATAPYPHAELIR